MASSNVIEILIKATDQTGNVVTGVAGRLKNSLGGALKLGALGAGAGLGAMTGFLSLAAKEAIEAEQTQAELNAVLRSTQGIAGVTADAANDLASKWAAVTMFSDDAIISGESMLLTFTNIGSDVFPQATEATINLAQKFGSMESASTMVGKALNDPVAGLTALTRVGVSFTDEQKEQIRAMQESGDLAGAQKVILGELERQYGGLAVAAGDTLAGKFTILKNKFYDVAEGVGMKLIPALSKGLDYAVMFGDWAAPKIGQVATAAVDLWARAQPSLAQFADWFTTSAAPQIVAFIEDPVLPTLGSIGAGIMDLWGQAKPYLEEFGVWFLNDALPAVVAFIKDPALPTLENIGDTLVTMWTTVSPYLSQFLTWFTVTALPAVATFVTDTALPAFRNVRDTLSNLWTRIEPGLSSMYNWFVNSLGWVKTNVIDPLLDALNTLQGAWNDVQNSGIVKGASSGLSWVGSKTGLWQEGGYTGPGPSSEVAGLVHRNEWVVPERGALVLRGDGGGMGPITINITDGVMDRHPDAVSYGRELAASLQAQLRFAGGGVVS